MDEKFWSNVHKRSKEVLDGVTCLRQGARSRNPILIRHRFILLKTSVEKMLESLNATTLAFGSKKEEHAEWVLDCFVRSITGYHRLLYCMAEKPESILETIDAWHDSLEVVVRVSLREARTEAASEN